MFISGNPAASLPMPVAPRSNRRTSTHVNAAFADFLKSKVATTHGATKADAGLSPIQRWLKNGAHVPSTPKRHVSGHPTAQHRETPS